MKKRRVHFAAPFVLVTACGQPAPVEEPVHATREIEGMDYVARAEAARGDGGVDAAPPVDATPEAAPDERYIATIIVPAHEEQPGGYVSCHNFGPHNRGCNPPRPVRVPEQRLRREIIDVADVDGETMVLVATERADTLKPGMPVTARTPSMPARAKVGRVHANRHNNVALVTTLSKADVMAGARLEIDTSTVEKLPPPKPIITSIVQIEDADGYATVVTVGAGHENGVDRGWHLEILDARDRAVRGSTATIAKVTKKLSFAKVKMSPSQVGRFKRVRLSPPPDSR